MKKKIFIKPRIEMKPLKSETLLASSGNVVVGGGGTNEQNAKAASGGFSMDFTLY